MPPPSRQAAAPPAQGHAAPRDVVLNSVLTLLAVIAAAVIAAGLVEGPQTSRIATMFLATVLIVAVVFGLVYGLVAAVAAMVGFKLLTGMSGIPTTLWSEQGFLLMLLAALVTLTGLYTDVTRRRTRAAGILLEAGKPLSAQASGPALGEFLHRATPGGARVDRLALGEEAQRALISFCIVGVGWTAVLVVDDILGPSGAVLVLLASVLVVGGTMGAQFGLAAGILAILARYAFPGTVALPRPYEVGFELIAFAAIGWGIGRLADRRQQERRILGTLISASRDLAAGTDEAKIRRALFDSLITVVDGGFVVLSDETGATVLSTPGAPAAASSPVAAGWRERRLASDGRDVGEVRWTIPRHAAPEQIGDEIAISLIDLGASAIVRARLSVEKSEMEFVARSEHLRTILLDAVSHHFRSPLAGILGSVTSILALPEHHDRGSRRELLLIIKEQANRLNRYVENFLSVARLESGSIDVDLAEVAIEPLIYDVWETFGEAGGARRFLHVKVDPDLVRADPKLLEQVFGNVLENAIKYSAEGSLVDVRSRRLGDRLVIDVTDQGPGIPDGAKEKIFGRFYRSHGANVAGLGLGLYITRSLVVMLGGAVEADNRADGEQGLVMSIALPLAGETQ